ncbi:MAG: hypothetical protein GY725_10860 [bacterium]|nr:hypothetical protein [bacterium]
MRGSSPGHLDAQPSLGYGAAEARPGGCDALGWRFREGQPEGGIGNSAGKLAPNVDVRGDGGQVVFVGSIHPETSVTYEWAPGLSPDDVGLAELPPHVLRVLRDQEVPSAAGEQKLNRACEVVAGAQVGTRNDTLNRQAFIVGGLIQKGEIQEREALARLGDAARQAGLADDEVDRTLARAVQDGKAKFSGPQQWLPLLTAETLAAVSIVVNDRKLETDRRSCHGAKWGAERECRRLVALLLRVFQD